MMFWNRQPPEWAGMLAAQVAQVSQKIDGTNERLDKLMSEDAAIEAQVAILVADATALKSAFATLQAEVAAGGAPSAQTMTDLQNAVSGITGTIPPAPTPAP